MKMQWFGDHWGAPLCDECDHVETPVGSSCTGNICVLPSREIKEGQRGIMLWSLGGLFEQTQRVPVHFQCFMREILGPSWDTICQGIVPEDSVTNEGSK